MPGRRRALQLSAGDRRFCRRGLSVTTTASRKRQLQCLKPQECRMVKDTTRCMRWTGEFASLRLRPSHVTKAWGLRTQMTDRQAVLRVLAGALDLVHRAGGHAKPLGPDAVECWRYSRASGQNWVVTRVRGVHTLFAHSSLFGLRSVSEQCRSSRSTRLYLIGRTRIMSLCCFFQVSSRKSCAISVAPNSVTRILRAAFSRRPSLPIWAKNLYCLQSPGTHRCSWSRNEICVLVYFFTCQKLRRSRVVVV